MKAYVFPGQGSQFTGMGKDIYDSSEKAKAIFHQANEIMGFDISQIMFTGTDEDLKRTDVTQPAVFIHSMAVLHSAENVDAAMVAGHSLGEFSALVAAGVLDFASALKLVKLRADAMKRACDIQASTMAAVIGMDDKIVEDICASITDEIVVAANYNSPGQLVISGTIAGIDKAIEKLTAAGCRRALKLPVGGAFHSPCMEPARQELADAINSISFNNAKCPVYQNVPANAVTDATAIKSNLIAQLTAPVKWTQSVENMIAAGATSFIEVGPGKVLQGLVKKVNKEIETSSL
jgi:[acyl-carrier-protein] S-malonyltransferase